MKLAPSGGGSQSISSFPGGLSSLLKGCKLWPDTDWGSRQRCTAVAFIHESLDRIPARFHHKDMATILSGLPSFADEPLSVRLGLLVAVQASVFMDKARNVERVRKDQLHGKPSRNC